jgi:hypothetical protein
MDIPNGANVASEREVDPLFGRIAPAHMCYTGFSREKSRRITMVCRVYVAVRAMLTDWQPAGGSSHAGLCLDGWYIVFVMMI